MKRRNAIAILCVIAVLAVSPGCAKQDAEKLTLKKVLTASAHQAGVYRYRDETPASIIGPGQAVAVRGLIEDDFRFKARISFNGTDVIDEVVNDDALAVRFLDPALIPNFTEATGGTPEVRQALAAKYWVVDPKGAPVLGGAAVEDRVLGVDPIVDSLSVIEYASLAIDQSAGVKRFNEESIEYRPAEDPFPKPAKDSGIVRWDLVPPGLPRGCAGQQRAGWQRAAREDGGVPQDGHLREERPAVPDP